MAKPPKLLRYPLDVIDSTTDYMFIEVLKYEPGGVPSFAGAGSASQATSQAADSLANQLKGTTTKQSIVLPMPNSIAAVNRTGWGESRLSALAGAGLKAAGLAVDAVTGRVGQPGAIAKNFADTELEGIVGGGMGIDLMRNYFKSKAQLSIVNALAGTNIGLNDVLGRQSGQIVNQNVELLFNGVSIRPFGFNFDFTPRNEKESEAVLQIIKTFKRAAAPKKGTQNAFLQAPDVFRLTYKKGIGDQRFLNKFKICALTSVGVDYTGSGMHATYEDGTPVHYKLNLSFTELEPIYAEDYGDNFDDVGY
tara:strand:- start:475 stop:1395 length:921 start_codon:yes stop_codon:yes gene_type:complete